MYSELLVSILLAANLAAPAREKIDTSITGMYSNLELNDEGGDLLGMEVYLVSGTGEYFAVVQCAGGVPGRPVITSVQASGATISFKLPEGQPECGTSFTGTISKKGLRGRFLGEEGDRWLPRGKGYWE